MESFAAESWDSADSRRLQDPSDMVDGRGHRTDS